MTQLSFEGEEEKGGSVEVGSYPESLPRVARKVDRLELPGMKRKANRSLFIFSSDNFIRKYAQTIIEWSYPCAPDAPATTAATAAVATVAVATAVVATTAIAVIASVVTTAALIFVVDSTTNAVYTTIASYVHA